MSTTDFQIKQGDALPKLRETLRLQDRSILNLTGATVRFRMRIPGQAVKVDRAASVVDAANGVVEYTWQAGDTDTAGLYSAEWAVTFPGGVETIPGSGYTSVLVAASLADALVVIPSSLSVEAGVTTTVVVKQTVAGVQTDVTSQAAWMGPASPALAQVASGVVTGLASGSGQLTATAAGLSAKLDVTILPGPPQAGLLVWMSSANIDGQRNATLTAGDKIATWKNRGSGGMDATAAQYYKPTLKKPTGEASQVQFGGVQSVLTFSASQALFSFLHTTGVYDIFMCLRRRSTGVTASPFGSVNSTADKGIYVALQADGTINFIIMKGSPGVPVVNHITALNVGLGVPAKLLFRGDGSNSKIAKNDFTVFDSAAFANPLGSGNATRDFHIGDVIGTAGSSEGGLLYDGDLFEFLVYNRNLTPTELTQMQTYFTYNGL